LRTCSRQHVIEIIGCGESDGLLYVCAPVQN